MLFGSACFVCSFIASLVHWNTSRPLCLVPMCGRVCVCVVVFFSTNTWEHWGSRTKCTLLYCIIQDQIYLNLTLNRTLRTGLEKKKCFHINYLFPRPIYQMESTCAHIPSLLREAAGRTVGQTATGTSTQSPILSTGCFFLYIFLYITK